MKVWESVRILTEDGFVIEERDEKFLEDGCRSGSPGKVETGAEVREGTRNKILT